MKFFYCLLIVWITIFHLGCCDSDYDDEYLAYNEKINHHISPDAVCENECPATQMCVNRNVCGCGNGYHLVNEKCQRNCENCESGECSSSGSCILCDRDYTLINGTCQLPCVTKKCQYGYCSEPENCVCPEGFAKSNWLCYPECKSGCVFADCIEGGVCSCWNGYVYNAVLASCQKESFEPFYIPDRPTTTTVTPKCQNGCIDGANRYIVCSCKESMILIDNNGTCQCFAKNSSRIHKTALRNEETTTDVTLTCPPNGCEDGICINGTCQCEEGLIFSENRTKCLMPCGNTCQNGYCNQRQECECKQGFALQIGLGCVPKCDRDCLNGACVAVNKCQCFEGFSPKPGDQFACELSSKCAYYPVRKDLLSWIILLLAFCVVVIIGLFVRRKMRSVRYNVDEDEKRRSVVFIKSNDVPQCDV